LRSRRSSPLPLEPWQGTVERLAWGGKGVGRLADGRIVLLQAPLALFPGEAVRATVRQRAQHAEGEIAEWVSRDSRRVPAACPVALQCGGCSLWEAGDSAGELKRLMVADLLRRQLPGGHPWEWLPAPPDTLRHRIQLHWDGAKLGFHACHSHAIVEIDGCPLAAEPVSRAIPHLREALSSGARPAAAARWQLATGTPPDTVVATCGDLPGQAWRLASGGWQPTIEPLVHALGDSSLTQPAAAFFQVCPAWSWQAFDRIFDSWDLRGGQLYDLYGGVGFFSLLLNSRFRCAALVESNERAVEAARLNLAQIPAEITLSAVEQWLPTGLGAAEDLILLDPPRAGLPAAISERLLSAQAGALVLVGCDGAAFCRDVKRLAAAWRLSRLAALDLFPNTAQVEFVGLLENLQSRG
jgi:23S rRNA (uracil1939-C5)-methyltransferase